MPAAQDITEKLEEQESRQAELNHYVKMVLPVEISMLTTRQRPRIH